MFAPVGILLVLLCAGWLWAPVSRELSQPKKHGATLLSARPGPVTGSSFRNLHLQVDVS